MAVRAAPNEAAYHNTLGIVLGDLRQWGDCLAALGEAVRLDPANFEAHRNLGVAFSKVSRVDDALEPLRRAAELRLDEAEVWFLLTSLHHGRLDLPAAISADGAPWCFGPPTRPPIPICW
jgi:superkiller protein 3